MRDLIFSGVLLLLFNGLLPFVLFVFFLFLVLFVFFILFVSFFFNFLWISIFLSFCCLRSLWCLWYLRFFWGIFLIIFDQSFCFFQGSHQPFIDQKFTYLLEFFSDLFFLFLSPLFVGFLFLVELFVSEGISLCGLFEFLFDLMNCGFFRVESSGNVLNFERELFQDCEKSFDFLKVELSNSFSLDLRFGKVNLLLFLLSLLTFDAWHGFLNN